jgi:hypothetical protein
MPGADRDDLRRLPVKDGSGLLLLLNEWMADESGYEEQNWPELKRFLDAERPHGFKLFSE